MSETLDDLDNHKFIINNSCFIPNIDDPSSERERKELLENRKVNPHYHPDKGSKFDVDTPEREKFPHVADRLGHPEQLLNPFE